MSLQSPLSTPVTDWVEAPFELAPNTYWVGRREPETVFHSNTYLRRFHDLDSMQPKPQWRGGFNVLIDPGSLMDFPTVQSKVSAILGSLDSLAALFINHQDPDVCSSAAIICARYAPHAAIVCSEDTWRLIAHMNLQRSRFVSAERFPQGLKTPTGQDMVLVPTPFCHFRGAVMLYDPQTRVLFSGDLFGGLTAPNAQGLWADESDWAGIRAFHQLYMPVNAALVRAVEAIRKLEPAVEFIAPQHGRIIRRALIPQFLERMERLQVGLDLMDEGQDSAQLEAWNAVMDRVVSLARCFLGSSLEAKLSASQELSDTASFDGLHLRVKAMGKWTLEHVVGLLCHGEPPEIAGPLLLEAGRAAAECNLPTPHLDIEGNEAPTHLSLLGN